MAERTRDGNTDAGRALERHTGADAILKFTVDDAAKDDDTTYRIPVTNVQWTRDYTTEEVQHNGSLNPTLSTSEIRYSGSFDFEGQNPEVMDLIMHDASGQIIDRNRPVRGRLTIEEYNHADGETIVSTVIFKRVLVTSNDRDLSVGDISSTTFDWQAEDMKIIRGSASS